MTAEGGSFLRRIGGGVAVTATGRIVAAVLQAVLLVALARSTTPQLFGAVGLFLGIATILQTVSDCGMSTLVVRERAHDTRPGLVATAIRINGWTSTALAAGTSLLLLAMGFGVSGAYLSLLPLALWISGERNADVRLSVAFADGKVGITAANLVVRRLVGLGLFLLASKLSYDPLLSYSLAVAVAAVASSVFANVYIRRHVDFRVRTSAREAFAEAIPYWVTSVATQARNLDVVILGWLSSTTQVGYYAIGSRLVSPLRIFPTSLASVILPNATREYRETQSTRRHNKLVLGTMIVMTILYLLAIVVTPFLVRTVLGPQYEPATHVLQVIEAGLPFAAATSLISALLQARGLKAVVARATLLNIGVFLVLIAAGSAIAGAIGAAIATLVSFAINFFMLLAILLVPHVGARRRSDAPDSFEGDQGVRNDRV